MTFEKRIAVIGQGIIGLTTAIRLMQAGYRVDIIARDDLQSSASMSAGAYWWPHKAYPQERVADWAKQSFDIYRSEAQNSGSGIFFQDHYRYCVIPDDSNYALELVDDWELLDHKALGIECHQAYRVQLPVIDVPIYLAYLKEQLESMGVNIIIRDLTSFDELFSSYDLIVNCSGNGAQALAKDPLLYPIRGPILRLKPVQGIKDSMRIYQAGEQFVLILPRSEDLILGGSAQENNFSTELDEEEIADIFKRCVRVNPLLERGELLDARVGFRPGRESVRLEIDPYLPVIHNYGHGGGGFTIGWGCAFEVTTLTQAYFTKE